MPHYNVVTGVLGVALLLHDPFLQLLQHVGCVLDLPVGLAFEHRCPVGLSVGISAVFVVRHTIVVLSVTGCSETQFVHIKVSELELRPLVVSVPVSVRRRIRNVAWRLHAVPAVEYLILFLVYGSFADIHAVALLSFSCAACKIRRSFGLLCTVC